MKAPLSERKLEFPVERAVYLAALARLFFPGSDRRAMARARDCQTFGEGELSPHHLCRGMSLMGEARERVEDEPARPFFHASNSKGPRARGG